MDLLVRPWKLYLDGSGRSRRSEFWIFYLIKYGLLVAVLGLGDLSGVQMGGDLGFSWPIVVVAIWMLATFLPSIMLLARRLHDFNAPGAWLLTTFIPYIGLLAVAVIGLLPGTAGENDKGFDPRRGEQDERAIAEVFE